jgi:uncharacterized protein
MPLHFTNKNSPNKMGTTLIVTLIFIGLLAGILSGLVGIGGGIILIPCFTFLLHYSQHQAQGTSLGILALPVSIFAFIIYYNNLKETNEAIDYKVILIVAIGFILGSVLGSKIAITINQSLVKKIFGFILLYTAFKMFEWDTWIVKLFK